MNGEWLTYAEAGQRLGLSAEAVRHRARRMKWPTQKPNKPAEPVLIQIPDGVRQSVRTASHERAVNASEQALADTRAALESERVARITAEGIAVGLRVAVDAIQEARQEADARADREAAARQDADARAAQASAQAAQQGDVARQWQAQAEAAQQALEAARRLPWWRRLRGF